MSASALGQSSSHAFARATGAAVGQWPSGAGAAPGAGRKAIPSAQVGNLWPQARRCGPPGHSANPRKRAKSAIGRELPPMLPPVRPDLVIRHRRQKRTANRGRRVAAVPAACRSAGRSRSPPSPSLRSEDMLACRLPPRKLQSRGPPPRATPWSPRSWRRTPANPSTHCRSQSCLQTRHLWLHAELDNAGSSLCTHARTSS